jgi:hypothetical protein
VVAAATAAAALHAPAPLTAPLRLHSCRGLPALRSRVHECGCVQSVRGWMLQVSGAAAGDTQQPGWEASRGGCCPLALVVHSVVCGEECVAVVSQ